jgi:hypothetical protein
MGQMHRKLYQIAAHLRRLNENFFGKKNLKIYPGSSLAHPRLNGK